MKIAFISYGSRPYSPEDIENRAIGGTETSIYNTATALAHLGHNVTVYGNCDKEYILVDGNLHWKPYTSYIVQPTSSTGREFDVVISVEIFNPALFLEGKLNYIWLHNEMKHYKDGQGRNRSEEHTSELQSH